MTDDELKRAIVRLDARRHWRKVHAGRLARLGMALRDAWRAVCDWRCRIEGAIRGWR